MQKSFKNTVIHFFKIAVQFLSNKLSKITFTKSQQPYNSLSPTNSFFVQSSNKKINAKRKEKYQRARISTRKLEWMTENDCTNKKTDLFESFPHHFFVPFSQKKLKPNNFYWNWLSQLFFSLKITKIWNIAIVFFLFITHPTYKFNESKIVLFHFIDFLCKFNNKIYFKTHWLM